MLARSKLNSIEDKISKSLINNEIIQIEEGKKQVLMKLLSLMKLLITV